MSGKARHSLRRCSMSGPGPNGSRKRSGTSGMSGSCRTGPAGARGGGQHERGVPEPRGGPAAGPREGEPGAEPGKVQTVLPEAN